jgi:hypothetical protein
MSCGFSDFAYVLRAEKLDTEVYTSAIKGLCTATGIEDWEQVVAIQHVTVNNVVVGLINDDETNRLLIYVDFGQIFQERDPDLYRRMLLSNIEQQTLLGFFGIHPESDNAVYHMRLDMQSPIDGQTLAEVISTQIELAAVLVEEWKK